MEITCWTLLLDQRVRGRCHGASKRMGSFLGVYSSIVCDIQGHRRIKSLLFFFFFPSFFSFLFPDHTTAHSFSLPGCFVQENKHVEHTFDMIDLGQNQAFLFLFFLFLHRRLGFSGYLVYLQMLPFCILQRVLEALCGNASPT